MRTSRDIVATLTATTSTAVRASPGLPASQTRLAHARQALSLGAEVDAQVISVDPQRRRISLSIAAATKEAEVGLTEEAKQHLNNPTGLGTFGDLLKSKLPRT
jgi:transcriptional accessory protein Tex/SPT6